MNDRGCKHHPSCFSCPFSDCLLERNGVRDLELLDRFDGMVAQGMTGMGAAAHLASFEGVIVRTIQCRLDKARKRRLDLTSRW